MEENAFNIFKDVSMVLADGTTLNLVQNGDEYESDTVISDSVLSESNLQNVTIDGVKVGAVKLNSKYAYNGGTRFSFREQTAAEKLQSELTQTQLGLAEVYELLVSK